MADDDDARDFTASERKALRHMLQSQQRAEWLWSTIRIWAAWLAAVIAGAYAVIEVISRHVRIKIGGG